MRRDYREPRPAGNGSGRGLGGTVRRWFADAAAPGCPSPTRWSSPPPTRDGPPSARTVLLKVGRSMRGFVFFTNYTSRKGRELAANPQASLVFPWFPIQRQVIVGRRGGAGGPGRDRGVLRDPAPRLPARRVGQPAETVVPDRAAVDAGLAAVAERFGTGRVPAPPHWGGLRVVPETVEFWQGRSSRMHDRLRYRGSARAGSSSGSLRESGARRGRGAGRRRRSGSGRAG